MIAGRKTTLLLLFVILAVALVGIVLWIFLSQKLASIQEEPNERSDLEQVIVSPPAESVASPSQSASATTTPGFKLYRNEERGFEFEYPGDWTFHANTFYSPFSKFNLVGASPEENGLPDPLTPSLLVNIVTPDFADRAIIGLKNLNASTSIVMVVGIKAIKYEYEFERVARLAIDIPFGEYKMLLGAKTQYEDVFSQILSTFKFIEL